MENKRPQDISSLERENRINDIYALIIQGYPASKIVEYCGKTFKTKKSVAYEYINEAKEILKKNFEKTFDKELFKAEVYERLENLYQQSFEIDDFKECRNILKDIREMFGLNAPTKTDVTTNGKEIKQNISILNIDPLAIDETSDDSTT